MSFSLYITRLKCITRNKENIFWSYAFPILLASCFFFAFGNLWDVSSFETIQIGYVSDGTIDDPLLNAMEEAKMSEDVPLFAIKEYDQAEAIKSLEDKEIEAFIIGGQEPVLHVKENGINETIIKSFLDNYRQMVATVEEIIQKNPDALSQGLMEDIMNYDTYVYEEQRGSRPDYILIYFYALFAYTCIFGGAWGLDEVINIQADMSLRGARVNVSPVHKMRLLLCNMLAAFTAHSGSILLLFVYMNYILGIKFGDNLWAILLTCIVGSFTGLMQGIFIGVVLKQKPSVKEAVFIAVTMFQSFLAGFMIADMKYIIAEKVPFLSYINSVNLISDALYSLYYYDSYDRYILNIVILLAIAVILGSVSYLRLRRKTYASI
ncbi:MAG: ABC transporter permease [Clostridiales bacterium]|nr:ABC transporter permease [Clostridiales bacterium]